MVCRTSFTTRLLMPIILLQVMAVKIPELDLGFRRLTKHCPLVVYAVKVLSISVIYRSGSCGTAVLDKRERGYATEGKLGRAFSLHSEALRTGSLGI